MLVAFLLSFLEVAGPALPLAEAPAPTRPAPATRAPRTRQTSPRGQRAPGPTLVRLTNDSVAGRPFGPEPTVRELLTAGGRVVSRRPCRNLYEANQTDTLLLVRHQGNVFEFYRAPEKDLLRDARVINFQTAYGRRLRHRLAAAHRPKPGATANVRIGDTERINYVSVIYRSGQLRAVHVQPYAE
ncbi:hypothetical protein KLP40_07085 [Hymenobacter sp. NST-14]|uniref:hypothetical protein n=1 Tax=Hymenobacter piscis TaxID=2839984 RepID=UPI001C00CE04|nr:hypothetical protein [Hymenobacter piscis]MBT9392920.1 hypothetical protein [Hymenobacter piscis]